MNVNSLSEALPDQDVINLIVVFPTSGVPFPSSGRFLKAKGVCRYYVAKR